MNGRHVIIIEDQDSPTALRIYASEGMNEATATT